MANATINVTACDNELYLIAVNAGTGTPSQSYQLVHIESGNSKSVNVTATVSVGTYVEPQTYNGVNNSLVESYPVSLPTGTYSLVAIGINWGIAQNFSFTLNGTPFSLPLTSPTPGFPEVVWTPKAVPFTIG